MAPFFWYVLHFIDAYFEFYLSTSELPYISLLVKAVLC